MGGHWHSCVGMRKGWLLRVPKDYLVEYGGGWYCELCGQFTGVKTFHAQINRVRVEKTYPHAVHQLPIDAKYWSRMTTKALERLRVGRGERERHL